MMTAQYQAALHSYAEGRYEEAVQQFSELLHDDPHNPKLHIWLGATFRKAGKIEYAKTQYQQVLTLTDDPDLLDLASTSLAQIQNKLANTVTKTSAQKNLKKDLVNLHSLIGKSLPQEASQKSFSSFPNVLSENIPESSHIISPDLDSISEEAVQLTTPSVRAKSKVSPKFKAFAKNSSNGSVPPPPNVAAQVEEQQQDFINEQEVAQAFQLQGDQVFSYEDITENATSSILVDTIANIQKGKQKSQRLNKSKKNKVQVQFPPLESSIYDEEEEEEYGREKINDNDLKVIGSKVKSEPIALEDIFKFSTVGQKITLWGAVVSTIPAILLGVAAYQIGDSLLLGKVKQRQQVEVLSLAKAAENFLQQQTNDVSILKTLLVSTDVGQNTLQNPAVSPTLDSNKAIDQQRQYKQLLSNRLNLYSKAYSQYNSIAIFSNNGELLSQSSSSKGLQTLNPSVLNKVDTNDSLIVSNPVVKKDGAYFYVATAIKSSIAQKTNMFLQVEIPVSALTSELTNNRVTNISGMGNVNFYVIDSANKYIAGSQSITGGDALADFSILSDLRSAQLPDLRDIVRSDRNVQILAYAPVANMQKYGVLTWDVVTTIDKSTAISGSQNLLLAIGIGIAATPLLVGAVAYALTRRLSRRLKYIRHALRSLRKGNSVTLLTSMGVGSNDELTDISLSINKMSEQFYVMSKKHEQENQRLQLQAVKLFKVLSKLAREEKREVQDADLSDENILLLGKKIRSEMVQRNVEVESYRKQKEDFKDHLMQMLKEMQGMSNGDLTLSTKAIDGNLVDVSVFFDDVMRGLHNIIGQVKSSANQVNFSLGQNEQAIANLVSVSQRQVDTVARSLNMAQIAKISASTIVNSSEQIVHSSQLVSDQISSSDSTIDAVMQKVAELQGTVKNTAKKVKNLGEASQKISKAISSINEIAVKTNFLAINATLEASRSGTSSNFVMVAEEVGQLAARSVSATKEVESLLSGIQRDANEVMMAVETESTQLAESNILATTAKDSLKQIAQISQQIDELMSSISGATLSQVQTSEGVANLMKDIAHIANRTLTSSSEVSKFIKSTRRYSGDLQHSLTHLKTR